MPRDVMGRLVSAVELENGVRITVNRGTAQGVTRDWIGVLMVNDEPMDGGQFVITSLSEHEAAGTVPLAIERVDECTAVGLGPG